MEHVSEDVTKGIREYYATKVIQSDERFIPFERWYVFIDYILKPLKNLFQNVNHSTMDITVQITAVQHASIKPVIPLTERVSENRWWVIVLTESVKLRGR